MCCWGKSMGIAPERTFVPSVATMRIRSRALLALPLTALLLDLVMVTATDFIAFYGRSRILVFGGHGPGLSPSSIGPNLAQSIAFVAVPLVVVWVATIALRGDEYRRPKTAAPARA